MESKIINKLKRKLTKKIISFPFIKNELEKKYIKKSFTPNYNEDKLITRNIPHFIYDDKFIQAYEKGKKAGAWESISIRWRAYVCCWAATYARNLEGDFIELGVDKAGLALCITDYIGFKNLDKQFYLIDSFEGIPLQYVDQKEFEINDPHRRNKKFGNTYNLVKDCFKDFNNVHVVKGVVPDILPSVEVSEIAFMSIDMNNYYPEIEGVKYFWDKIVKHGIIVLDDYAHGEQYSLQRQKWDEFAQSKGLQILNIPTGQGILIKY